MSPIGGEAIITKTHTTKGDVMGKRNLAGAFALVATLVAAPAMAGHHEAAAPEAATAEEPRPDPVAAEKPPAPAGSVARAQFARDVVDREPTNAIESLPNDQDRIFFFTELHGLQGQEVTHRWEFDGEVKAEVAHDVRGPRWRVFSSKALDSSWLGTWTVSVVDAHGNLVAKKSFDYVEAAAPPQEEPAANDPVPASIAE